MHYLAYGSNLHPLRLALRVPSARLLGTTRLDGYRLTFQKRSTDGSSKCTLEVTSDLRDMVYGAVYDIPSGEAHLLDEAEGLGNGYRKTHLRVNLGDKPCTAFLYLASRSHISNDRPYHWYKNLVLAGARRHRFPADYILQIADVSSKPDPAQNRRIEMENLLIQLGA